MKQSDLKIVEVDVNALKPAEYNPRKASDHEVEHLRASIEKFGFIDPIIVNSNSARDNVVIGGHFRLRIAKELGMKTVPVIYLDIADLKEEKELNIRLNKNTGSFDYEILGNQYSVEDLTAWGFTYGELGMSTDTGRDLIGVDDMANNSEGYDGASIRSIGFYFPSADYGDIIRRMDLAQAELGVTNYTECFIKLIENYENRVR